MNFARTAEFILVCAGLSTSALGREICYLANGFQIEGTSHTVDQDRMILKTPSGSMEFPLAQIVRIEEVADPAASKARTPLAAEQILADAAEAEGLPSAFVSSVAKTESAYNPNAISVKGALGLMQLMPATAAELGVRPAVPQENALGGSKYLRNLLVRYKGNVVLALAAYNAGPNAVAKYGGVPPYAETRQYVERVLREYLQQQKQTGTGARHLITATAAKKPSATD